MADALPAAPCDFCAIAAHTAPADIRHKDDDLIVFRNRLRWAPLMLLVAPIAHLDQRQFWSSPLFARAASLAVEIGEAQAPGGYRLLSNFGEDALQTQEHGHLHIIGGASLGLYANLPGKHAWQSVNEPPL